MAPSSPSSLLLHVFHIRVSVVRKAQPQMQNSQSSVRPAVRSADKYRKQSEGPSADPPRRGRILFSTFALRAHTHTALTVFIYLSSFLAASEG